MKAILASAQRIALAVTFALICAGLGIWVWMAANTGPVRMYAVVYCGVPVRYVVAYGNGRSEIMTPNNPRLRWTIDHTPAAGRQGVEITGPGCLFMHPPQ